MSASRLLKKDVFGEIWLHQTPSGQVIERDARAASVWVRGLARRLLRREARVLRRLANLDGVPRLVSADDDRLTRQYIEGQPMQVARPVDPAFFRQAQRLLRQLHARDVVHNDLAKEPNILVTDDQRPVFIDFQLAWCNMRRGRAFRVLAREDIRHLLKHKRTYCVDALTTRERAILATPSLPARAHRFIVKPVYLFITRRILGWADREGAGDRNARD